MKAEGEAVKATIVQAFRGSSYPGDDNLVIGNDRECREIAAAFRGREWRSISHDFSREQKEALPLLAPEAFRYFLPAYLISCIDARNQIDVAWDSVIFNLTPPKARTGSRWDRFEQRITGFTRGQGDAILNLLAFMDEEERAEWMRAGSSGPERLGPAIEYWRSRQS
jgi:hypothetical protein